MPPKPITRQPIREHVYTHLRNSIVHGELQPQEKLRDTDLAKALGVSRTPVREALRQLEDEGLVETKQNAWTRVAALNTDQAKRIYPILRNLEPLALELAAPHLGKNEWRSMRQLNRAVKSALRHNNAKEAALCDSQLHTVFIERCHNPELVQIIANLKTNHIRLELHYWQSGNATLPSLEEHETMIAALELGNMRAAKNALAANWTRALKRFSAKGQP